MRIWIIAATLFQSYVLAQNYTIDPSEVSASTRQSWCLDQTQSCSDICGGSASSNTCNPSTLSYSCVCTNGAQPNISDYQGTIPSYECLQWVSNCVANNTNSQQGQEQCQSVRCGSKDPSQVADSSSVTSTTTTIVPTTTPATTVQTITGAVATTFSQSSISNPASISTQSQTTSNAPALHTDDAGAQNSSNNGSHANIGAIAGGVVGGVLAVAIIAAAIMYLMRRKRKQIKGTLPEMQVYPAGR